MSPLARRRRRRWRLGAALPAALVAVVGITVGGITAGGITVGGAHAPLAARPVSFADRAPLGAFEHGYHVKGGLRVIGWAFDPDARTSPVAVIATVDGTQVGAKVADVSRPDVAHEHPNAGAAHGFDWRVRVPQGRHTVCVTARNMGDGHDVQLGCRTRTFDYRPFGSFDGLGAGLGTVRARAWTMDRDDVTAPLVATVTVDGVAHRTLADVSRPDVAAAHTGAGADHGVDVRYPAAQGAHTVCITVRNIGFGTDANLGCKSVVLDERPVGHVDSLTQQAGRLDVRGWAFDRDAPTSPTKVVVVTDGTRSQTAVADLSRPDVGAAHPSAGARHGFDVALRLPEGRHTICVTARNLSFGSDRAFSCHAATLDSTPDASLDTLTATRTGAVATGWTSDPDTTAPIAARITVDGATATTVRADGKGAAAHTGHYFSVPLGLHSGTHSVCVMGLNVGYGSSDSTPSCRTVSLTLDPIGAFDTLTRTGSSLTVTGWAFDPDTTAPVSVVMRMDGNEVGTATANVRRPDVAARYPTAGAARGISTRIPADDGEHTVCLTATNVGGGEDTALGCKIVNAVHPVVPAAPSGVTAVGGYGSATVSWVPPVSDGGAPWIRYAVEATPGGPTVLVPAAATTATVTGLKSFAYYHFTVYAVNVVGRSAGSTAGVRTLSGPPPQRTPAPVATSRYIRNVRGSSSADLSAMRAEGVADAKANPTGHSYLVLLDIGGQDEYDGGVVLSAGIRFVSYGDLVRDVDAYVDGYHSAQRSGAPAVIALGTNNDIDVSTSSGASWADRMVDPVRSHAAGYDGLTIAGANDIEPGFRATYSQTARWLRGYLAATSAKFVFNGSADGCAWTVTDRSCNNGWTMAGLYYLAAGAAPTRMINLPQVYNTTMAAQWKYISLTGVGDGSPRINFGGPLTELTACRQAGSCGSLSGHTAWRELWNDLQSDSRLRVPSLPYSTDLRIDY